MNNILEKALNQVPDFKISPLKNENTSYIFTLLRMRFDNPECEKDECKIIINCARQLGYFEQAKEMESDLLVGH